MVGVVSASLGASCGPLPLEPDAGASVVTDAVKGAGAEAGAPSLSQVSPASGPVGTMVTINGSGFASSGNTATFGAGYIKNIDSADGTALRFAVPDGLDLCSPDPAGPCPAGYPQVRPGDYVVAVIAGGKKSNGFTFTVTRP